MVIKGKPEEIAALVQALQERQVNDIGAITQQLANELTEALSSVHIP